MGYQTNYTLRVNLLIANKIAELTNRSPLLEVIKQLRETNEEAQYSLTENGDCSGNDSRWYNHQEDLRKFSKLHPNILFSLHGEGEESGDLWNEYFLNGKCQVEKAQIQIAPFDVTKLE